MQCRNDSKWMRCGILQRSRDGMSAMTDLLVKDALLSATSVSGAIKVGSTTAIVLPVEKKNKNKHLMSIGQIQFQ